MEIVRGKKEALYWEKVPERVRRQAVQKAMPTGDLRNNREEVEIAGGQRKRKKRQHNN
jgi:hypothetical protein